MNKELDPLEEPEKLLDPMDQAVETLARLLSMMRLSAYVFSVYCLVQGTLIILGGPARFSSTAYNAAMFIPEAPSSWGWALGIFGTMAFVGVKNRMYRLAAIGMFLAGSWSIAFGMAFLISSVQYPDANLTAIATYGKDAFIFILMAIAFRLLSRSSILRRPPDA